MLNNDDVISIAIVTGEDIEPAGLPVLKVYRRGSKYVLGEGKEQIENAVIESIKQRGGQSTTLLFLRVEISPMSSRGSTGVAE